MEERGHGNHWGIFGEPEDVLVEAMKNLNRHQHPFDYGNVVMREFGNKEVCILGIIDAPGKISTLSLVACNVNGGRNEMVSMYPSYLNGTEVNVVIDDVDAWPNGIEAIVCGVTEEGAKFYFFATDYFAHTDKYKKGNSLIVHLSAFAYTANILTEEESVIRYVGQDALDWIANSGSPKDFLNYTDDGTPIVEFYMDALTALFPDDPPMEDDAEFQSPVQHVKSVKYLGQDIWKINIFINRDPDIEIPLFVLKSQLPNRPRKNQPLRGYLWLQGNLPMDKEI